MLWEGSQRPGSPDAGKKLHPMSSTLPPPSTLLTTSALSATSTLP